MNKDSDIKLLLKAQKGDRSAFQTLFDKYYQKAISVSFKILENMESAEDVVMDSFLDMYNLEITKDINFYSYFTRVIINNSLNVIKKNKHITGDILEDVLVSPSSNPEEITEKEELVKDIFEKLKLLPDNQRIAFILVKYEGYSYTEVASIMKTTVKAVEGYMFRARKSLNDIFGIKKADEEDDDEV